MLCPRLDRTKNSTNPLSDIVWLIQGIPASHILQVSQVTETRRQLGPRKIDPRKRGEIARSNTVQLIARTCPSISLPSGFQILANPSADDDSKDGGESIQERLEIAAECPFHASWKPEEGTAKLYPLPLSVVAETLHERLVYRYRQTAIEYRSIRLLFRGPITEGNAI